VTATIAYDRTVANYIDRIDATGHVTHTKHRKTSVTFHHNAGRLSLDGIYQVWKTRRASAHFQVDGKGAVGQYVRVNEYAWAVGNTLGNQTSISIEMANATTAPKWLVAEDTWKSAARLAAWLHWKVLGVRPVKGKTLHRHHDWAGANTACAGPFVDAMWNELCAEVVRQYDEFTKAKPPTPPQPPKPLSTIAKVRTLQTALEVTSDGKWGDNTDDRAQRMRAAAYQLTYAGRFRYDVRDVQKVLDTTPDGDAGPKTVAAMKSWIKGVQKNVLQVTDDGVWGPNTDKAFWALRTQAYNKF
jgi:N-acetyl-anhydromuramyl-L-alanine amidase AmpD